MDRITVPDSWRYARVREDIDAGRLWKARDRLQGHLAHTPADQVVLDLLGSVWFAMGDLPQAGRHWFLTERTGEDADVARAAFLERYGRKADSVLHGLPRPVVPGRYPDAVRARLEELIAASTGGGRWRSGAWATHPSDEDGWTEWQPGRFDRYLPVIGIAGTIGLAALVVIGLVTVLGWIVDLANDMVAVAG